MGLTFTRSEKLEEKRRWEKARRSAFVQDVLGVFTQRPTNLVRFEEVRDKLKLRNVRELGLQNVPLDHIVGSVGRYQDFNRAFLPRRDDLQDRWRRIDQLMSAGRGYPPIDLYKVGAVYFVRDGNHRVSVARQHHFPTIQACVWEWPTDIPLGPDNDIDNLLCQIAQAAFLEQTGIDHLCPDVHLALTQADGYQDLLDDIQTYQHILSTIDGQDMPFDEAVTLWCEMRYSPIVDIMRGRDILRYFPGRTEADLFLWLCRNQQELQASYEGQILMEEAADDLGQRFGRRFWLLRPMRRATRRVAHTVLNRAHGWWRALRRALKRRREDTHGMDDQTGPGTRA